MRKSEFKDYKLSEPLLKAISLLGFQEPTEVQEQVIPLALARRDVLVKSKTGSGKTAAFGIPICELIDWEDNNPQALVLTPTRELAIQIGEDLFNIGRLKRIKAPVLYGRSPISKQIKELKQKSHVVVGTPGRVLDHIGRGTLNTECIKYLVLDEADEMLNMGFFTEVEEIIKALPENRVTMLFSATLPGWVGRLAQDYMTDPVEIEVVSEQLEAGNISQEYYRVTDSDKFDLLKRVTVLQNPDSCIVFCNTQQKVEQVCKELAAGGYPCAKIHGGMMQEDRTRVMQEFKRGAFRYLAATDVAARGIDIDSITLIVNLDAPETEENYVHRIGRTGRIGKSGAAITFVTPQEDWFLSEIEKFTGTVLTEKQAPDRELVDEARTAFEEKLRQKPEMKEEKGAKLSEQILRLHINAGKKTKMRAADIVGALCSVEGMTAEDIGIINVLEISTFVEVLNGKGELVLQGLQGRNIKGRPRKVSKAEPRI